MPYGKRYYRGKKKVYRGRRRANTRGKVYGAAAYQLYKDVQKLKNMINVEYKFHDYSSTNDLTSTPVINPINFVNEGDTDQTHDGSMFRIKSVQINATARLQTSTTTPVFYRLALVLDTDAASSTTAPTYSDIYDSSGEAVSQFRNLDNRSRFIILKQWDRQLNPQGKETDIIRFYRRVDLKTQIVGTASEANLRKNGLYLVMVSSSGAAGEMGLNIVSRIRYIDN